MKVQKKYRKSKNQIDKTNKGPKTNSQPNSLNSSFKSDNGGVSATIVDDQHHQIISLKTQLNEHKLKEMQLFHEKENLINNCEHLNKLNDVCGN